MRLKLPVALLLLALLGPAAFQLRRRLIQRFFVDGPPGPAPALTAAPPGSVVRTTAVWVPAPRPVSATTIPHPSGAGVTWTAADADAGRARTRATGATASAAALTLRELARRGGRIATP